MKINDKLANGLYLGVSNIPGAGVGLFTGVNIPAGTPLCEFKGDIFKSPDAIKARYQYTKNSGLTTPLLVYGCEHSPSGSWIDSHPGLCKAEMGLGQFVNDARNHTNRLTFSKTEKPESISEKKLEAGYNCTFWPVPNEELILLIALVGIESSSEILVDYGDEYWAPLAGFEEQKKREIEEKAEQKKEDAKKEKNEPSPA